MKKIAVSHLKISEIMSPNIITVNPMMSIREIIKLFLAKRISGAPVVHHETGVLLSVVSESDLMKIAAIGSLEELLLLSIEKLPASNDLIAVKPDEPFSEAFKKFLTKPVRRVLVVDNNFKPVGIIARSDIIRSFIEHEDKGATEE